MPFRDQRLLSGYMQPFALLGLAFCQYLHCYKGEQSNQDGGDGRRGFETQAGTKKRRQGCCRKDGRWDQKVWKEHQMAEESLARAMPHHHRVERAHPRQSKKKEGKSRINATPIIAPQASKSKQRHTQAIVLTAAKSCFQNYTNFFVSGSRFFKRSILLDKFWAKRSFENADDVSHQAQEAAGMHLTTSH